MKARAQATLNGCFAEWLAKNFVGRRSQLPVRRIGTPTITNFYGCAAPKESFGTAPQANVLWRVLKLNVSGEPRQAAA